MLFFMRFSILRRVFLQFCGQETTLEVMRTYGKNRSSREKEWGYISSTLKDNEQFIKAAVQQDGETIEFVNDKWKKNSDIVEYAILEIQEANDDENIFAILKRVLTGIDNAIIQPIMEQRDIALNATNIQEKTPPQSSIVDACHQTEENPQHKSVSDCVTQQKSWLQSSIQHIVDVADPSQTKKDSQPITEKDWKHHLPNTITGCAEERDSSTTLNISDNDSEPEERHTLNTGLLADIQAGKKLKSLEKGQGAGEDQATVAQSKNSFLAAIQIGVQLRHVETDQKLSEVPANKAPHGFNVSMLQHAQAYSPIHSDPGSNDVRSESEDEWSASEDEWSSSETQCSVAKINKLTTHRAIQSQTTTSLKVQETVLPTMTKTLLTGDSKVVSSSLKNLEQQSIEPASPNEAQNIGGQSTIKKLMRARRFAIVDSDSESDDEGNSLFDPENSDQGPIIKKKSNEPSQQERQEAELKAKQEQKESFDIKRTSLQKCFKPRNGQNLAQPPVVSNASTSAPTTDQSGPASKYVTPPATPTQTMTSNALKFRLSTFNRMLEGFVNLTELRTRGPSKKRESTASGSAQSNKALLVMSDLLSSKQSPETSITAKAPNENEPKRFGASQSKIAEMIAGTPTKKAITKPTTEPVKTVSELPSSKAFTENRAKIAAALGSIPPEKPISKPTSEPEKAESESSSSKAFAHNKANLAAALVAPKTCNPNGAANASVTLNTFGQPIDSRKAAILKRLIEQPEGHSSTTRQASEQNKGLPAPACLLGAIEKGTRLRSIQKSRPSTLKSETRKKPKSTNAVPTVPENLFADIVNGRNQLRPSSSIRQTKSTISTPQSKKPLSIQDELQAKLSERKRVSQGVMSPVGKVITTQPATYFALRKPQSPNHKKTAQQPLIEAQRIQQRLARQRAAKQAKLTSTQQSECATPTQL